MADPSAASDASDSPGDRRHAGTHGVVTGASSGIGQAIAIALAQSGADKLLIHYRGNRRGAEQTAASAQELGCEATTIAADLSRKEDIHQLSETAFDRLGVIHTWVHNAGADVLTGSASQLDFDAKLQQLIQVDVIGTIMLAREVGKRMLLQTDPSGTGALSWPAQFTEGLALSLQRPTSMVFIGWDQAPAGMEGDAGQLFAPTKGAVMAYAASLAQTLAPYIRVNTVAPGWIRTSWGDSADDYWNRRAEHQSLMNRWGRPEDVAQAVLYAADPANTFLTGQTIEVNGGWNRRYD